MNTRTPSKIIDALTNFRQARLDDSPASPYLDEPPSTAILGDPFGVAEASEKNPNIADARVGYQQRIRTLFDKMVHELLMDLRQTPSSREEKIRATLSECLTTGFEFFWGVLESACRMRLEVNVQDPLEYLDFMEALSLGFIHAYQNSTRREEYRPQIAARASQKPAKPDDKTFRGASTPDAFPLFQQFADACARIPDGHQAFHALSSALIRLSEEATGQQQGAQPVETCSVGWQALLNELEKSFPSLKVYTSTQEYLGMLKNSPTFGVVEGRSEQELIVSFQKALEEAVQQGHTPVVLLSSVRRTGERIDVNRIHHALKETCPQVIFVVDGAQDHLMYPGVDAVLYSKRLGATGTGLMFLNKTRFDDSFYNRFALRHGVKIRDIAHTLAALRCERLPRHFASLLSDLPSTASLWEFVGGGNYIEYEGGKVVQKVSEDPYLSQHFEARRSIETMDSANPHLWRSSQLIALRLKEGSSLSLQALTAHMKTKGYYLDWISIQDVPAFLILLNLATLPYSEEHCKSFFEKLIQFQHGSDCSYLTEMLSLPEVFNGTARVDQETYARQVAYLRESGSRQNMLRFLIDITKSHEAIIACLNELSASVRELTPTASREPMPFQK